MKTKKNDELFSLTSVGKATVKDFAILGIFKVADLKNKNGQDLFDELCRMTGDKHNICCLDVFNCAIAQAENPDLPSEQREWWYWAQKRKSNA